MKRLEKTLSLPSGLFLWTRCEKRGFFRVTFTFFYIRWANSSPPWVYGSLEEFPILPIFTVNYFRENIEGFHCENLSIEIGIGTYYLCDSSMVNHDTKKKKREKK